MLKQISFLVIHFRVHYNLLTEVFILPKTMKNHLKVAKNELTKNVALQTSFKPESQSVLTAAAFKFLYLMKNGAHHVAFILN